MKCFLSIIIAFSFLHPVKGQSTLDFADSIRKLYHIPEIGFAIVSSDSVFEMATIGVKRMNTNLAAEPGDKFRIGSNTKAITGFITAQLVKQGKISWDTRFFDLFPEMKAQSRKAYHELTLQNLLTFRARLFPYTYTNNKPAENQFSGSEEAQRLQFTAWFFRRKPVKGRDSIHFSNLCYIAAAQMLEKVSGKPYKKLVTDLGEQLEIHFGFGNPNFTDSLQPWGHDKDLNPEPPGDNYKLNRLLAAGNIHTSLPDYAKFIQLQLKGLSGQSELLTKEEFSFLHFGLPTFAVGWFWSTDEENLTFSYNIGNPGSFLTKVFVFKDCNRAFILFANAQTPAADTGLNILYDELRRKYYPAKNLL